MGVLTDFFVASREELGKAFPAWLAVAPEPVTREITNPFTGKKQTAMYWQPVDRPLKKCSEPERLSNYQNLPHAEFKRVGTVELAKLHALISDISYAESMAQFNRPALIDPWESEETGLFGLSADFVSSLASIRGEQLADKAAEWAETEEMKRDHATARSCEIVLGELMRLARDTQQTQRGMYYWWSL